MKTVLLQYVGKSQMFVDSLRRGSGRIWNGRGSVLEIPANESFVYLAHPTLFRVTTREQADGERNSSQVASQTALAQLASIDDAGLKALLKATQNEIEMRHAKTINATPAPQASVRVPTAAEVAESGDTATMQAYNERIQRLVTAIRGMDLKDDSIARNGRPTPEGVRDHMGGQLPTEDEITMAMQLIDGVVDEPVDDDAKAKVASALAELAAADRATMNEMVKAFGIQAHNRLGDEKLREKIKEHLETV